MGRDPKEVAYEADERAERRREERRTAAERDKADIRQTVKEAIRVGIDRAR